MQVHLNNNKMKRLSVTVVFFERVKTIVPLLYHSNEKVCRGGERWQEIIVKRKFPTIFYSHTVFVVASAIHLNLHV